MKTALARASVSPPPHLRRGRMAAATVGIVAIASSLLLTAPASAADDDAITRLAGADRYATAVAVSKHAYPDQSPRSVVIASGADFADALAAAPAARAQEGPILLTPATTLIANTRAELQRLKPESVTIVGGPGAVSWAVQAQIKETVGATVPVNRWYGENRYETSAKISAETFEPGVALAFVASGVDFPDALAAAPVAGSKGAPILLSKPDQLSISVKNELERLKPNKIVLLGGTGAMGPALARELAALAPEVERIGGVDRFETARLLSQRMPQTGTEVNSETVASVFLANGLNFPDALAAGPVAAAVNGTVLITKAGSLHSSASGAIKELRPDQVYLVGGPGVLSSDVESGVKEAFKGYYQNCQQAVDAGKAPLTRGEPGYSQALDRDNDGSACDTEASAAAQGQG